MARRQLTRHQVLRWKDTWDDLDRARIANALDVMPSWAEARIPNSESYIGIWLYGSLQSRDFGSPYGGGLVQERWHRGLVIHPSRLEWPGGMWCDRLDKALFPILEDGERDNYGYIDYYQWFPLSTHGVSRARGARSGRATTRLCPVHHVEVPVTGVCDFC